MPRERNTILVSPELECFAAASTIFQGSIGVCQIYIADWLWQWKFFSAYKVTNTILAQEVCGQEFAFFSYANGKVSLYIIDISLVAIFVING